MDPTPIWLLLAVIAILRASTTWRRKSSTIRSLRLERKKLDWEIRRAELLLKESGVFFTTRPLREKPGREAEGGIRDDLFFVPLVLPILIVIFLPLFILSVLLQRAFIDVLTAFLKIMGYALLAVLVAIAGYRLYQVGLTSWKLVFVGVAVLSIVEMWFILAERSAVNSVRSLETKRREIVRVFPGLMEPKMTFRDRTRIF